MKKIIILLLLFLCLPYAAGAATASITQTPREVGVGDTVAVVLSVSSAIPINTFSGLLQYPKEKLELAGINDGNSIISLWLTKPVDGTSGIRFEGLVPGGYSGNDGVLFTVFFKAKESGVAEVSLEDTVFLLNDGSGSAESVSSEALLLAVGERARGGFMQDADADPPELFAIQLGSSPDLFDGRSYIAFTTTDKGSGIGYYEVAVKATDNAGNERVAAYPRTHLLRPYEWLLLGILGLLLALYYVKRKI